MKHHGAREISQKNVEDTVWFLLLLTVKCDEKKKNIKEEAIKQKRNQNWVLGKFSSLFKLLKMLKHALEKVQGLWLDKALLKKFLM